MRSIFTRPACRSAPVAVPAHSRRKAAPADAHRAAAGAVSLCVSLRPAQEALPWRNSLPGVAPVHLPSAKVSWPLTMIE